MISMIARITFKACLGVILFLHSLSSSGSDGGQPYQKLVESIQAQIIDIGLSEKTFLHSVGRSTGSVMDAEESFFVTTVDLDNLEIIIENGSRARVQLKSESRGTRNRGSQPVQCKDKLSRGLRPPAVALIQSSTLSNSGSVAERNDARIFQAYVLEQFKSSSLMRGVRKIPNSSQYERLIAGGSWNEPSHEVRIHLQYDIGAPSKKLGQYKPSGSSKPYSSSSPYLKLTFSADEHELKSSQIDVSEAGVKSLVAAAFSDSNPEANPWVVEMNGQISQFIKDLSCLIDYPSLAQVKRGKLYLEAGLEAGYFEGDKVILIPNSAYFRKRGLLAASDRIAVASVSSIDNHRASLEVISGSFDLEDGAEFNVRPILELL